MTTRLYDLLPALHRIADEERGGPLRALLELIGGEADALREDVQRLWDDYFVETCRPWAVPYIGDLVGTTPLHALEAGTASATAEALFDDLAGPDLRPPIAVRTRADVARTIFYRRRKGTAAMLEALARDVTGWDVHVVEFFALLDAQQQLEHIRLHSPGCPDLRSVDAGLRVGGAWDSFTHTVDVRRIDEWQGWHNIPNVGFFVWRLGAFRLTNVTPRAVGSDAWRQTFSPLGQDVPLFSAGRREDADGAMATEDSVMAPIRSSAFHDRPDLYYGDPSTGGSLLVRYGGQPVGISEIACRNLAGWDTLPVPPSGTAQPSGTVFLVDVERGRLIVPTGRMAKAVTVSYHYGFSAPLGGGEYERSKWLTPATDTVSGGGGTLANAIATRAASAVIEIRDDATYVLNSPIQLAAGESLTIQAAHGARPHVRLDGGKIEIKTQDAQGRLTLNGLLIEGGLEVTGDLRLLRLLHVTLVPGRSVQQEAGPSRPTGPSLDVAPGTAVNRINTQLEIQIAFSITGALRIPSHVSGLWLLDSIVDGVLAAGGARVDAVADAAGGAGPPAHVERSTLLGATRFLKLTLASESIFTGPVTVDQRQRGCVRFSCVAPNSATPQQYRCQPSLEQSLRPESERDAIARRLVPSFVSQHYGRPGYAQLRRAAPRQIRAGAEDESEMGAFSMLKQPQRESNLAVRLDEYLPVGLEAGVIYAT